jgi:cytochrome P450
MASTKRKYELYSPEFRADPYRVFAQMRGHDPVLCQPGVDGESMIWFLTRHDDVAAVLLDDERFVRDPRLALTEEELAGQEVPAPLQAIDNHMLNRDGQDHRRLRRLVTKAFTPKVVEQLRPRIQAIADELLDAVEPRGSMDLSADYAFPLPITVIAELLGVPTADQRRFEAYCLGAPLARLEAEIALETLFRRLPNLKLAVAPQELQWRATPTFRRLETLPVVW